MDINTEFSRAGLKIGQLARATKCNIETIRYYERAGLLPLPPRTHVQAKITDLKSMERVLRTMIARCKDGNLPDCPLTKPSFGNPA